MSTILILIGLSIIAVAYVVSGALADEASWSWKRQFHWLDFHPDAFAIGVKVEHMKHFKSTEEFGVPVRWRAHLITVTLTLAFWSVSHHQRITSYRPF